MTGLSLLAVSVSSPSLAEGQSLSTSTATNGHNELPSVGKERLDLGLRKTSNKVLIPIAVAKVDKDVSSLVGSLDDDQFWQSKASKCGFCKFMIESPCASQYKKWDMFVQRAKLMGTMVDDHSVDFGINECMQNNPQYFKTSQ